jgi:hypothetical protein
MVLRCNRGDGEMMQTCCRLAYDGGYAGSSISNPLQDDVCD